MRRVVLAALLCSTAILVPQAAEAGPLVSAVGFLIGGAGFGAVTSIFGVAAGTLGFSALTFGLRIAGSLALSSVAARLAPRPRVPPPADRMRNFAQERAPMERIYGRVRKGGPMGFTGFRTDVQQITGYTGTTPILTATSKPTRYNVILIAAHRTKGLVQWYLDSREAEVDANSEITTAPMAGHGALRAYRGAAGQAPDPVLRAVFGEITADHDFAGLSYVVLEARRASGDEFTEVYPSGMEWQATPVWDGDDQIFDPRDDSTGYSANAALVIAREATFWGREVDWDEVAAEADICDQLVTNGDGGTQLRWTINLTLDDSAPWETVRDTMGLACGAWWYQRPDGKLGFKVGRWIAPTVTLTDRDFLSLRIGDQEFGPDVAGEFVVTYIEPSRQWREAPSGAFVVEAGKARREEPCYAIDSHNQAARVAKLLARAARPDFRVSGTIKLIGYEVIGQRFVRITSAALGRDLVIEVTKLERNSDGISFAIEGVSTTEADYDFNAAVEEPARPVNLAVENEDAVPMVMGLSGAAVAGTGGVAQIEWSWTAPADAALRQVFRLRSIAAGMVDWQEGTIGAKSASYLATGLLDGAAYDAQVRSRAASGRMSADWSDIVTVTAVANSTAPAALVAFAAAATGGGGEVTFTAPNDPVYYAARIFRGPTTTFDDAGVVRIEYGASGIADLWTDAGLAPGTYSYWAEPINASGIAGPPSGPSTITII